MNRRTLSIILTSVFVVIIAIGLVTVFQQHSKKAKKTFEEEQGYVGSRSCRECHEKFYELWSPSHHGKAMQPISDVVKTGTLVLPTKAIQVGKNWFSVEIVGDSMYMLEKTSENATSIQKKYTTLWALGGRNIFYFLTPFTGGRLQTMPLAYDINRKEWYSNPQSAVRHFVDQNISDGEIDWTHSLYTFNTTCHNCHVSQLDNSYDEASNTYHTTWKEPGINCETCHGPCGEHVALYKEAAKTGVKPTDMKIISTKKFTPDQHNSSCAPCHAKMIPLTESYVPGETFFQNFNLVTLEDPDFYPDGRDLGENYTQTSWLQSPCAENSNLNCITCHTSSGRYRFKGEIANNACLPCHQGNVSNFTAHSHHPAGKGVTCISCHMPKTEFARMTRSDHSMRPPMPASSIEFGSPNACILCHKDETNQWANKAVTKWKGDYQSESIALSRLIKEAREGNFKNADKMFAMVSDQSVSQVFRTSMIRLLVNVENRNKEDVLVKVLNDRFPMVRAAAAEALQNSVNVKSKDALLVAARDSFRVVRIGASIALSHFPREIFSDSEWLAVENSYSEYTTYLSTRKDSWSSHYNLGNFYQLRGMYAKAVESYDAAAKLEKEAVSPRVNASLAYSQLGDLKNAEARLKEALSVEPNNSAVNFNYGLLLGQLQRYAEAKACLKRAIEADPHLAAAAYNLAVISAIDNLTEAVKYSKIAADVDSENPKFGYTYAFYLKQAGKNVEAINTLKRLIKQHASYADSYIFLGSIYEEKGQKSDAINVYNQALSVADIDVNAKQTVLMRINMLK